MDTADRALAWRHLERAAWLGADRKDVAEALLAHGSIVRLAPGQWAHAEGDDEAGILVVLDGVAHLLCKAPGGREVLIGQAGPGAAIGQTTRFGGGPRLVTVICPDACTLLRVSDRALSRIAAETSAVWEAVAALLYLQLRGLLQLAAEMTALAPRQRLAGRLDLLSGAEGGPLRLSQEALAEMVGLSRKTVNGYLGAFERQGLVRRRYGVVEVLDRAGLRRIAAS